MSKKRFVIKKYVLGENMADAILRESTGTIEEVWIDNDYKPKELESAIGFHIPVDYNFNDETAYGKRKSKENR